MLNSPPIIHVLVCQLVYVDGGKLSELVRGQLESLVKQSSPYLVVAASAAGDLPTLKDYLNQNPEQVRVHHGSSFLCVQAL